ncbi:MAG TPA: intradiol ring-cleavage dioxygenase [Acidimicrobiales bacterium]
MTHISRRHALAALGSAGLGGLLAACRNGGDGGGASITTASTTTPAGSETGAGAGTPAAPGAGRDLAARFEEAGTCRVTPEQTEGPYHIDVDRIRSDIRDGRPGLPLRVGVRVLDEECRPIPDAVVELWHCDGDGVYSGFGDGGGETFLRGGQVTGAEGIAEILTIYPGWYPGRTVHVHTKVHLGNREVLTTQLYFDDEVSDTVFASTSPYDGHPGRDVTNADDVIFQGDNLLTLSPEGDGWLGLITLTVDRG